MADKIEICRMAASIAKASTPLVADIDNPTSDLEEILALWYDKAKKMCLNQHPWSFALKTARLQVTEGGNIFGYKNAYTLPTDLEIPIAYQIGETQYEVRNFNADIMGDVLMTYIDEPYIDIKYVADISEGMFTELFSIYVATTLAYLISPELNASDSETEGLKGRASLAESNAKTQENGKVTVRVIQNNGSLSNPYGGYDNAKNTIHD